MPGSPHARLQLPAILLVLSTSCSQYGRAQPLAPQLALTTSLPTVTEYNYTLDGQVLYTLCPCKSSWWFKAHNASLLELSGCANPNNDPAGPFCEIDVQPPATWCPNSEILSMYTNVHTRRPVVLCLPKRARTIAGCLCSSYWSERDDVHFSKQWPILPRDQLLAGLHEGWLLAGGARCLVIEGSCTSVPAKAYPPPLPNIFWQIPSTDAQGWDFCGDPTYDKQRATEPSGLELLARLPADVAARTRMQTQAGCTCSPGNWTYFPQESADDNAKTSSRTYLGCSNPDNDPLGPWCPVDPVACPSHYGVKQPANPLQKPWYIRVYFDYCGEVRQKTESGCLCLGNWKPTSNSTLESQSNANGSGSLWDPASTEVFSGGVCGNPSYGNCPARRNKNGKCRRQRDWCFVDKATCKQQPTGTEGIRSELHWEFCRQDCDVGEISNSRGFCDSCGANMYAFSATATQCSICPDAATCPGRDVLLSKKGFWHSHRYSTQIHACPNAKACGQPGMDSIMMSGSISSTSNNSNHGDSNMDWQCTHGYQGILCGSCSAGYGVTSSFRCGKCMRSAHAVGLFALGLLIILALLSYMSHATYQDNRQAYPDLRVSDLLKIFVLYVQYLTILGSAAVGWPTAISYIFVAVGFILSSCTGDVVSLDCIYSELLGSHQEISLAELRQLTYLLLPFATLLAVICAFVVMWGISVVWDRVALRVRRWRNRKGWGAAQQHHQSQANLHVLSNETLLLQFYAWMVARIPVIIVVVLYLYYPSLVRVTWSQFSCKVVDVAGQQPYPEYATADAASGYWVSDMQQPCMQGWHRIWALALGVPCAIIFCVGMPAGMLSVLFGNRRCIDSPEFRAHFGFLMRNYRPNRYCWEVVTAVQTIVLVGVSANGHVVEGFYEVVLFTAVFGVALVLNIWFKPFLFSKLQHMQTAALFCLCMTSFVGITLAHVDDRSSVATYREVGGVMLLVINAAFICWCIVAVVSVLLQNVLKKPLDRIMRHLLSLGRFRIAPYSSRTVHCHGGSLEFTRFARS